jgi:hypothetical protein
MPFYFLPAATPSPVRSESDAGVIATLTRKGWALTTPPTPGAGQTPQWDPIAKTWSLVDNPPPAPNYREFEIALQVVEPLMTENNDRMMPPISFSDPSTMEELGKAVVDLRQASKLTEAWDRFSALLARFVVQGGDRDEKTFQERFQKKIWIWMDAARFDASEESQIQGLLDTHLSSRNYTTHRRKRAASELSRAEELAVLRARDGGQFVVDDPTTPDVNEAWLSGEAP